MPGTRPLTVSALEMTRRPASVMSSVTLAETASRSGGKPRLASSLPKAIEKNDDVVYDVASGRGQIVGNVKHMPWFREAVADELETR